jgi:hypothetical protein
VTPQQINWLVHIRARDGLKRHPEWVPLLSRRAHFRGLVHLRQTFVLGSHWRRMATGSLQTAARDCLGGGHDWKGSPGRWDGAISGRGLACERNRRGQMSLPRPLCGSDFVPGLVHLRQRFVLRSQDSHGKSLSGHLPLMHGLLWRAYSSISLLLNCRRHTRCSGP